MGKISAGFFLGFHMILLPVSFGEEVANFTGHWAGAGKMTQQSPFLGNKTSPCRSIEITVNQVSDRFRMQHYRGICGALDSDWGPLEMEIRGTKLIDREDNEEVGSIDGNVLKSLFPGSVQYAFNLRLNPADASANGPHPTLDTYYGVHNMSGTVVIEGRLDAVK